MWLDQQDGNVEDLSKSQRTPTNWILSFEGVILNISKAPNIHLIALLLDYNTGEMAL